MAAVEEFLNLLIQSLDDLRFVKLSLSNYSGEEKALKNIYIREVHIKRERKLAFTFRYQTNDMVKNYTFHEAINHIRAYLNQAFRQATLLTTVFDAQLAKHNKHWTLKRMKPSVTSVPDTSHDKQKKRIIPASLSKRYLHELQITDEKGQVYKNAQNKYKQINHYIELLRPLIEEIGIASIHRVVDMGSGKGYLTFALYDYLYHELGQPEVSIIGVEFRKDLVDLCNKVAQNAGFDQLHFEQGAIRDYPIKPLDALIALHACDTATDDAIYQGIRGGAKLIVVAPCCHKQIRRQMETGKAVNTLSVLTRFGIFLERQAEMLTDGLRALILEYFGYKTNVFEFISDAHTPKNVLITGLKSKIPNPQRQSALLEQMRQTKQYFGIKQHYLEELLDIR
ncbi:SAM-dependent methyltransferase [Olivibacter ginsenosidimutans]|uniref:SAM-dependent methyltransferase n=1 Tax=Olivibacter ginsenosidimutans TaxID=1176537 RepID=A0ABP9AQX2_9SPHI